MPHSLIRVSLIFSLLCAIAPVAGAGLLCGTKVIDEGALSEEVSAACGPPTHVEHSSMLRTLTASGGAQQNLIAGTTIEIHLETWLYNFGPDKLMQRIRFQDGVVTRIESLGYGFIEDN